MTPQLPYSLCRLLSDDIAPIQVFPITVGLIHQTYRAQDGKNNYLLQSINTNIFTDPMGLIHNHRRLHKHFLSEDAPFPHSLAEPRPFPNGEWLFKDENQQTWRMSEFISGSHTRTSVENTVQAEALAAFFARFSWHASSLEQNNWHIPIHRFHDLAYRYEQLEEAILNDQVSRKADQAALINELQNRKHYVDLFRYMEADERFPLRMMHHDAKLSNVLIDDLTDTWLCPIDLDTVMPGYFFSDLGDMIRSICNGSAKEDSPIHEVVFRTDLFEALLSGYGTVMENSLTSEEKTLLSMSGILMTYMQSLRFLTDYLNGDVYYHISRPEQNLDRTINQFSLLCEMEAYLHESGRLVGNS
jgi:Ser/Thr protein kinase RdoA (MazF antagonist)